jgi:hypothetical protein
VFGEFRFKFLDSETCSNACWISRSSTVGMPSIRTPPFGFGISTFRTAAGRYVACQQAALTLGQCCCSHAFKFELTVSPSTPAAPLFRRTRSYACQRLLRSTTASINAAALPLSLPRRLTHPSHTLAVSDRYPPGGNRASQPYCLHLRVRRNSSVSPFSLFRPSLRSQGATMPSADFCRFITPPLDDTSPRANRQTSPGIAHPPSRLCLPHIRQDFPCRYWALKISASSPSLAASYAISVRQASVLPAASSRFHLTMDTLAVQLTIPPAGFVGDFHPLVNAPCRAHQKSQSSVQRKTPAGPPRPVQSVSPPS